MFISIVRKVIQVRNGYTQTKSHFTYKVFLNDIELAEFIGYNSLWVAYEKENFVSKLKAALPDAICNETTDQQFYKAAQAAALAKLTPEERKLLCI